MWAAIDSRDDRFLCRGCCRAIQCSTGSRVMALAESCPGEGAILDRCVPSEASGRCWGSGPRRMNGRRRFGRRLRVIDGVVSRCGWLLGSRNGFRRAGRKNRVCRSRDRSGLWALTGSPGACGIWCGRCVRPVDRIAGCGALRRWGGSRDGKLVERWSGRRIRTRGNRRAAGLAAGLAWVRVVGRGMGSGGSNIRFFERLQTGDRRIGELWPWSRR